MSRPAKIKAVLLIEDFDLYPRTRVDSTHVNDMIAAMRSGQALPPVHADRAGKRLVDGWHRRRAALKLFGKDAAVLEVIWHDYADDRELFEDAVRMNAGHGRKLTAYDRARIKLIWDGLHGEPERYSTMVYRAADEATKHHYAIHRVEDDRGGSIEIPVPLKRTNTHLDGQVLTEAQIEANEHASGWPASFHVNQLITAIEAETLDLTPALRERLVRLRELLDRVLA